MVAATMDEDQLKIKMKKINPCISCKICGGYLIDAITVTECLHTFCKRCIVKYLEDQKNRNQCPTCHLVIHQSHPLNYLMYDRTMQDIVYKLVPSLQENEIRLEREWYAMRGVKCPRDLQSVASLRDEMGVDGNRSINGHLPGMGSNENGRPFAPQQPTNFHRLDEQVMLELLPDSSATQFGQDPYKLGQLAKRYLRVSTQMTVNHLKKFLAVKLLGDIEKYKDIEISCNGVPQSKDHLLKFVTVMNWKGRDPPLQLTYRRKLVSSN